MDAEGLSEELFERCLQRGAFNGVADDQAKARPVLRLLWAKLLGVISGDDPEGWSDQLQHHRAAYSALKEEHRKEADVRQQDPNVCNPLSKSVHNPFLKLQANEDLLQEIWKDVERTFPEKEIFQDDENRRAIQRVLYHWCKACNPAVQASESYRQGMNELAAVCFYVVILGEYRGNNALSLPGILSDRASNEADTYSLFSAVLERGGLREMFAIVRAVPAAQQPKEPDITALFGKAPRSQAAAQQRSAVLVRSDFIFHTVLKRVDSQLHQLLVGFGVEPQLYLLRWLRLLFCREFPLDDTVFLWTHIFQDATAATADIPDRYPKAPATACSAAAESASRALPLADYFAVAMIEHLRSELLQEDESGCLTLLMKYPGVDDVLPLVQAAENLRSGRNMAPARSPATSPLQATESLQNSKPSTQAPPQDPLTAGVGSARAEWQPAPTPERAPAMSQVVAGAQGLVRSVWDAGRQALHQDGGGASNASTTSPTINPEVVRLQQRVQSLEQEKTAIMTKARQVLAKQTQELKAEVDDLKAQLAEVAKSNQNGGDHDFADKEKDRSVEELQQKLTASEEARETAERRAEDAENRARSQEARLAELEELQQKLTSSEEARATAERRADDGEARARRHEARAAELETAAASHHRDKEEFQQKLTASEESRTTAERRADDAEARARSQEARLAELEAASSAMPSKSESTAAPTTTESTAAAEEVEAAEER